MFNAFYALYLCCFFFLYLLLSTIKVVIMSILDIGTLQILIVAPKCFFSNEKLTHGKLTPILPHIVDDMGVIKPRPLGPKLGSNS
jgi:hypothetical protein